MKQIYFVVLLLFSIVACDKTGEEKPSPEPSKPPVSTPYLELSTLSLDFESGEETKTIIVDSMSNDTIDVSVASEDELWCSASFENKMISVSVTENDGVDTRDTEITVVCDGLTKKVTIRQLGQKTKSVQTIKILQLNIWQEGTVISGGYDAIVEELVRVDADFVMLSEVRNYNGTYFCSKLVDALKERGKTYYSFNSYDSGVLSKYPIIDNATIFPEKDDHGSIYKLIADMNGLHIAVYTAHLDYLNSAYYEVRGYDGNTWDKLAAPVTDIDRILEKNVASLRDDAIRLFIEDADKEKAKGRLVFLGGDFNEPSHLDWTEETKNMRDHQGLLIPWTVTSLLENSNYEDAYRIYYTDPVKNPGFTYPADCKDIDISQLSWTPEADERERIDYIYYSPVDGLKVTDVLIHGPSGSIKRGERAPNNSDDIFLEPLGVWPTDHKGLIVEFELEIDKSVTAPALGSGSEW